MKFDEQTKVGNAIRSVSISDNIACGLQFCALLGALFLAASAQSELYKYKDDNGEWIYTDRAPEDDTRVEVRELPDGADESGVEVYYEISGNELVFIAKNDYYAPVEVVIALDSLQNIGRPPPGQKLRWPIPSRSTDELMKLPVIDDSSEVSADFRYVYIQGKPGSDHQPSVAYRAPFSIAGAFSVTQAFPTSITHVTRDSYYAVDIAMPVGSDIHAAREGVVFEVASTNFRSSIGPAKDFAAANVVRVLHSDGTHAVYAHLNWNSIRVRPGDVVERGEFIAESGNTGFSTGPHLHFAVLRNRGLGVESVPVVFEGPRQQTTVPKTGMTLTAY
jgi:murein DD-endopeptidase MepM/ murein hydrolase activator NlpD